MTLVVDASVALKWVLQEDGSDIAEALAEGEEGLLVPDFWLHEAMGVCWLQVRKRRWAPAEAVEALDLLRTLLLPVPTGHLGLQGVALDLALAVDHSPYDTLYVAFAVAMGARGVVVADRGFVAAMRRHPDPMLRGMIIPLDEWRP